MHVFHLLLHLLHAFLSGTGDLEDWEYKPYDESEYHHKNEGPKQDSKYHMGGKVRNGGDRGVKENIITTGGFWKGHKCLNLQWK